MTALSSLAPSPTLGQALTSYRRRSGFPPDGGASERLSWVRLGPLALPLPNPPARQVALVRHDAHHVLLDQDASLRGEAVVAAFELGSGCGGVWVAWVLQPQALVAGLLCPRLTVEALALGRRSANFYRQLDPSQWLDTPLVALRRRLLPDAPPEPGWGDLLRCLAWGALGGLMLLLVAALLALPLLLLWPLSLWQGARLTARAQGAVAGA